MKVINSKEQFQTLLSNKDDFIIFKHSGRCSISGGACKEVEQAIQELNLENIYLLDVLHTGDLKYEVADMIAVKHESPQVLIFEAGVLKDYKNHGAITKAWLMSHCETFDAKQFFESYLDAIQRRFSLLETSNPEWNSKEIYVAGIFDEMKEVQAEMTKPHNSVYLEDELGDVLWDYMNLLYNLEKNGNIESIASVLQRSLRKYKERIDDLVVGVNQGRAQGEVRKETKSRQKELLSKEHQAKYL